jgi:putative transcriptional regulator
VSEGLPEDSRFRRNPATPHTAGAWRVLALFLAATLAWLPAALAQTGKAANGVFLVANPQLSDPNFSQTVVLVTQLPDGGTVGFIINRPGRRSLAQILPDNEALKRFTEPLYQGGPVEQPGLFAVFRSKENPQGALRVLDDLSFALDPAVVETLMASPPERLRLFNGYAGWMPGQLQAELDRGGWYVLNADTDTVFRTDMEKLWEEMVKRARSIVALGR